MMVSEARELRVEGGRVSHIWCKCVLSQGYDGLGGGRNGGGGWHVCWTKPWGLVACRETTYHYLSARRYTDDTQSHCRPGALFWVGSSWNWSVFQEGS